MPADNGKAAEISIVNLALNVVRYKMVSGILLCKRLVNNWLQSKIWSQQVRLSTIRFVLKTAKM